MTESPGSQYYSDAALVGETLGGDYLIEERVGQGGMAWVYKATHRRLGGEVAVKILFSHFLDDGGLRERFLREARSQYTLNHPHIVRVLDFIEESGVVGFVSEWCDAGELLRWWRPEQGMLSMARLQKLIYPIFDAMEHAHKAGIVHRDLKPHNILVQRRGDDIVPKVTDFGIAKFAQQKGLTRPGMMVGTLQYMAPEQLEGRDDADHRSDIYSLGVILYQMLAGYLPFVGESMSLVMKVLDQAPPPLPPLHIPGPLAEIVMRCLAKNPAERYSSCLAVKQALSEAIERCGPTVTLTESWQRRVEAVHSLDPEGDISLVAPLSSASSGAEEAGEFTPHPALERTTPGGPAALVEALLPSGGGSQTRTFPPKASPVKGASPPASPSTQSLDEPKDELLLPRETPSVGVLGQAAPAKASVLREIPAGLAAAHGGPDGMLSGPTKRDPAPSGWGGRLLLALLLVTCGGAAGSYLVVKRDTVMAWLRPDAGTQQVSVADAGRAIQAPDVQILTPRMRPPQRPDAGLASTPERRQPPERSAPPQRPDEGKRARQRRACREGDAGACFWVGERFFKGASQPKAPAVAGAQARHWLQKACDKRHPQGCFLLGRLFHAGRGGPRVDVKARVFFRQACEGRIHAACLALGELFHRGFGGPYDAAQAIAFYTRACEAKVVAGCRLAGVVWMTGRGHPRNCARANALLQRACQMGDRDACPLRCQDTKP